MRSLARTAALVAACILALTACSSDDGDDGDDEGTGGNSNGGSSNGGSGGSGGGMGDCTETGCPPGEMCTVCLGANGEPVNACISEGVACN